MSSPSSWADRRGMFQAGREKHEPGTKLSRAFGDPIRRASASSTGENPLEKTTSNTSGPGSPTGQRRRSSGQSALFNSLAAHKRGSEDYGDRRASFTEMNASPPSGVMSGWFNKTFKGHQNPITAAQQAQKEQKRGVME